MNTTPSMYLQTSPERCRWPEGEDAHLRTETDAFCKRILPGWLFVKLGFRWVQGFGISEVEVQMPGFVGLCLMAHVVHQQVD